MKFYVIGDVTVDHLYHLRRLPKPGEEVTPTQASMKPGGAGGTISVTLARLGHTVTLAARVGTDPFAEYALSHVRGSGVLEGAIQRDPERLTSTITVMQTASGERAMISHGAANRQLDPAGLKVGDIEGSDALIINAYALTEGPQREYTLAAIRAAQGAKKPVPVFIDLGTGAVNKVGTSLLGDVIAADYLMLNQHELQALTGTGSISAALAQLGAAGAQRVVVKVGKMGSITWTPTETELVDAIRPEGQVVDSTGAGDTFTATFAHAVLNGAGMSEAARAANAAGALAATGIGAQERPITPADLAEVLPGVAVPAPAPAPKATRGRKSTAG
ncbi:carbohydrate kinase family protein [Deinococcus multiflagellatus]|uniref:Carbohydrate kinase family protein n=1 Tax=Deinococcus multiflagellatus TaxID=1656887 RepID=A0ABW1ZG85_9DEIO|nr:carbohydrate kinase family protein [Deinococcus multiflagellatus]MBZ9713013.1 carbohydrate kinase family protein [Deinococcus multiflagellatus]